VANYSSLGPFVPKSAGTGLQPSLPRIVSYLVSEWLAEYDRSTPNSDVVETTVDEFSYLFDIKAARLIAAWGLSRGRAAHDRDKSRMAGHPNGFGALFHRGHAIPHRLGGGTDINLAPQLGSVNIGPFRALEREAVASPGSLYFTYWRYSDATSQLPTGVEQGLIKAGSPPDIRQHRN
jgi:hypothetical protein